MFSELYWTIVSEEVSIWKILLREGFSISYIEVFHNILNQSNKKRWKLSIIIIQNARRLRGSKHCVRNSKKSVNNIYYFLYSY